jgi:IclR family KDG regulon transcriptional repressor
VVSDPNASTILTRGLEILEVLVYSRVGLSADQLAAQLGLHRSSIYRYLNALRAKGFAEKDAVGAFHCGWKVLDLAALALERIDLRSQARPFLSALCERTQATVHLCRLHGSEVIYLDKIETERSLPIYSRVGGRAPAYCTGVGKALLSFVSPERLKRILAQTDFRRYTPKTLCGPEDLCRELEHVRVRRYAVDRGEHEEGIYCVAVPIFDFYGEPVAAISVTDVPRRIMDRTDELARELGKAAEQISFLLGQRDGRLME